MIRAASAAVKPTMSTSATAMRCSSGSAHIARRTSAASTASSARAAVSSREAFAEAGSAESCSSGRRDRHRYCERTTLRQMVASHASILSGRRCARHAVSALR